uniref:Uncharacterized protein n=1 Tax=Sphaerodactylus townsendi TaxID=933632 RepID=A0ACB8GDV8_9SAUR
MESTKWLPKSPKLHGSHNWSSQGTHRASRKGKESTPGGNLFGSTNEKWKEGRISPEQEAEELEDPDEDEPISKFSGSLFDSGNPTRDQRSTRVAFQESEKTATKVKPVPALSNKHPVPAAAPKEGNRRFSKETKEQIPRTAGASEQPLKVICEQ